MRGPSHGRVPDSKAQLNGFRYRQLQRPQNFTRNARCSRRKQASREAVRHQTGDVRHERVCGQRNREVV